MSRISDIKEEIAIPEEIEGTLINNTLNIKGEKGELSRDFSHPKIEISLKDKKILIACKNPRKKQKALVGTFIAHIKNMIKGTSKGFEYKMKTVFSHFPIKLSIEENKFIIQNFLGERSPRKAVILDGVSVNINGDFVSVQGIDIEKVGQTVANIEKATSVKYRDIRVFQDGVYLINKGDK
jgi:large subunit ribosomal protein L6